jgi:hypothetical protein
MFEQAKTGMTSMNSTGTESDWGATTLPPRETSLVPGRLPDARVRRQNDRPFCHRTRSKRNCRETVRPTEHLIAEDFDGLPWSSPEALGLAGALFPLGLER